MLSENYNNEAAVHCIMQIISSKKSGLVPLGGQCRSAQQHCTGADNSTSNHSNHLYGEGRLGLLQEIKIEV